MMVKAAATETPRYHEASLAGQVRDRLLDHIKTLNKPWPQLSEAEQTALIESVEKVAKDTVAETIDVVTGAGGVSIPASVGKVTICEGTINAKVSIERNHDGAQAFMDAAEGHATLVFQNSRSSLLNTGETPKGDPDQPAMFKDGDRATKAKSAEVAETDDELAKARARRSRTRSRAEAEDLD